MENNILINRSLISEINKFRKISNLPLVEVSENKNKNLLSEADRSKLLYQIALDLEDISAEGQAKREMRLMDNLKSNQIFFNETGARGTANEIKLGREKFIRDVESMIGHSSVKEIVEFIEKKIGKQFDEFERTLAARIDAETKRQLKTDLKNTNSVTRNMIIDDFSNEIQSRLKQVVDEDPLVKAKLINMMKEEFKTAYKELLGLLDSDLKILDDILDPIVVQEKKLLYTPVKLTTGQILMQVLRTSPKIIADLSEIINLVYLSVKKSTEQLEKEINDLVLSLESGAVKDKNGGVLIADRVKTLIRTKKTFDVELGASFKSLYDDLITKIKDAISDEATRKALLSKIEEIETSVGTLDEKTGKYITTDSQKINVLEKFFNDLDSSEFGTVADTWNSFKKKFKEFFSFASNPFGKTFKDNIGNIFQRTEGWGTRWATFFISGTLSTFREYVAEMAKSRNFLNIRRLGKVEGWGWKSVADMYIRIWLRSNVFIPMVYNLFMGIGGALWACNLNTVGDSFGKNSYGNLVEDETYNKYCKAPIQTFFDGTWSSIKDTFTPLQELINVAQGEDTKIDTGSKLGNVGIWFMEFFDMVIPFNSKVDDLVYWLFTDPKDKIEKKVEEENKTEKDNNNKSFAETYPNKFLKKTEILAVRKNAVVGSVNNRDNIPKAQEISKLSTIDTLNVNSLDPVFLFKGQLFYIKGNPKKGITIYSDNDGYEYTTDEFIERNMNESRYKKTNNMLTEEDKEKFGEDNFKHWKDTFIFKSQDDKNPGQYKEVKINMDDVMDRINHYRKKYDEDDAFVRAVIDTHDDVVKIMFTKDLANIHESVTPRGLALVFRTIKESRGEMEIFSVARPANGNWFLVKGDFTPNQLANMDLEKREPETKEKEVVTKAEDDLKKKRRVGNKHS